jgi:hypothetical protein
MGHRVSARIKMNSTALDLEDGMPTELALQFRKELNAIEAALVALPPELADTPWRSGGWTRKQVMGHLLDSAANNRQQEAWVAAHGYADQPWETLLRWWQAEHEILEAVVDRIPEEQLEASCTVGTDAAVTLRFLVEDYPRHQRWHLAQLEQGTA